MPWDGKRLCDGEDVGKVVMKFGWVLHWNRGFMENNKVIDPFHNWLYSMMLENAEAGICDGVLDATGGGQSFNHYMLDIHFVVPENREVFLVLW